MEIQAYLRHFHYMTPRVKAEITVVAEANAYTTAQARASATEPRSPSSLGFWVLGLGLRTLNPGNLNPRV